MTARAFRGAAARGVVGTVILMAIGVAPAASDQGEPGASGPPPAVPAGAGADAVSSRQEDATSSPGPGPVAALLPSASVTATVRAAAAAREGSTPTGPRAGGLGLPTLLHAGATWLRSDLPRHRRVLRYEMERGRALVAGSLPAGPVVPGLAVVAGLAGLAGLGSTLRRRRLAAAPAEPVPVAPEPAPPSRSERARQLLADGAGAARAARETGLGQEGLDLLDRLSHRGGRPDGLQPWGAQADPAAGAPSRPDSRPAPFHAVPQEMDLPTAAPRERAP